MRAAWGHAVCLVLMAGATVVFGDLEQVALCPPVACVTHLAPKSPVLGVSAFDPQPSPSERRGTRAFTSNQGGSHGGGP